MLFPDIRRLPRHVVDDEQDSQGTESDEEEEEEEEEDRARAPYQGCTIRPLQQGYLSCQGYSAGLSPLQQGDRLSRLSVIVVIGYRAAAGGVSTAAADFNERGKERKAVT